MADGWFESKSSLVIQNTILLLINILGVWRWLPRAEKEATGQKRSAASSFAKSEERMARAEEKDKTKLLTREEWRARRELRREKQREDNIQRAAKMHAARLKSRN